MEALVVVAGVLVGLAAMWLVLVVALIALRPKGISFSEAKRLVPDTVRLLRDLARDPALGRGVRVRLALLIVYLALPIDLVPDFIPVIGYADDVIVLALVLRSVVRRSGPTALERHWKGTPEGLGVVKALAGQRS